MSTTLLFRLGGTSLATDAGEVEVIEIRGKRLTEAQERAPTGFLTEIDLTEAQTEFETVPNLLSQSVGVQVRRFGSLGSFATISIRGSEPNQVPFYLDGIPLSRAQDETVNLSNLPLDSLDRIEVYRGTIPVGFGGGGIGGVVNLVTKQPSATPETEASFSYGSFDTRKAVLSHTRRLAGFDVLGHVTYQGSAGDFTFQSDNGTDKNQDDDFTDTRRNNEHDSVTALVRAVREVSSGLDADMTQELFWKEQGVPGPDTPQFRHTSLEELRSLTYLRLTGDGWADGSVDCSAAVFGIYGLQKFDDSSAELGGRQSTRNQVGSIGANTTGSYFGLAQATVGQTLDWFAELSSELYSPFDEFLPPPEGPSGPDQRRLRLTLSAQNKISLLDELFLLVPTLRYEHLRDDFSGSFGNRNDPEGGTSAMNRDLFSPSIGLETRVRPWFTVKGNIGRFQRAPNFSELFGNTGIVLGRGDLKEETSVNRDIGFTLSPPALRWLDFLRLEYVYFNNDIDDLITLEQASPNRFRPDNIGSARIRGHELTLQLEAVEHLRVNLNYTHQDSKNLSNVRERRGQSLPLRPDDELYLRVEPFNDWGRLYYELDFTDENETAPSNVDPVSDRFIHTLGFTLEPLDWLSLNFEVANFLDSEVRDLGDFPLPGRSFFGTIRATF
jgi:iron complex outermembrane receptor protein